MWYRNSSEVKEISDVGGAGSLYDGTPLTRKQNLLYGIRMAEKFPGHGFVGGLPYKTEFERVTKRLGFPLAEGEMTDETCHLCKDPGKANNTAARDVYGAREHVAKEAKEEARKKEVADVIQEIRAEVFVIKKKEPEAAPPPMPFAPEAPRFDWGLQAQAAQQEARVQAAIRNQQEAQMKYGAQVWRQR